MYYIYLYVYTQLYSYTQYICIQLYTYILYISIYTISNDDKVSAANQPGPGNRVTAVVSALAQVGGKGRSVTPKPKSACQGSSWSPTDQRRILMQAEGLAGAKAMSRKELHMFKKQEEGQHGWGRGKDGSRKIHVDMVGT